MVGAMNKSWLGILCAGPGTAAAGKCVGRTSTTVVSWDQTEIAKGTKLATWRGTSVTVADDANAPYQLVSGECIGSFLTNPDGKTRTSGFCSRRDKDGDVLYEDWISTDGAGAKGNWKNVGGTGKFARAANTAQWESSGLQGKMSAVRWVGDCQ